MGRASNGIGQTLVSLSVLAVLAGCSGGPGVTQNPLSSGSSGNSGTGGSNDNGGNFTPTMPTNPNPGGSSPNNPGTTTPPPVNEAIGDPATMTANSAVLTTTQTTVYNLNTAVLGGNGWQPAELLETTGSDASSPRVAFDAAGNGIALWAQGNHVYVSRYTSTSGEWGAPYPIDVSIDEVQQPHLAVDRLSGNAIATWTQNDNGVESIFASRYTASNQSWSTPQTLETTNLRVNPWGTNVAISGAHAAAVWRQDNGTGNDEYDVYLSRLVNGAWTTPQLVDDSGQDAMNPDVAVDLNGNTTVVWQQYDDQVTYEDRIHARRWETNSGTFGAIQQLDNNGDHQPRLQFDAQGNGFLLWRGGGIYARRFVDGLWGPEVKLDNDDDNDAYSGELSVDAAGNAIAVWVESDGTEMSMFARRFKTSTGWGNVESLETSSIAINLDEATVSLSGDQAVVAWLQNTPIGADDVRTDVYGAKLNEGVWEPATLIESRGESANQLASAITGAGNAAVLWVQPDSIYQARHLTSNFRVQTGDTWQSIANTLYGVNSVEAGNALQTAMGGGALVVDMILSGFPATLSVTTSIPPYYTVQATDTWAHIAQRVYGVTDAAAIAQLQTLLGNPTLTAGQHLVVPTTVTYVTSANYRAPLDWTRVVTTSTEYHQLDADLLTAPLNNWNTAELLDTDDTQGSSPRVEFDADGNGIAVWAQGTEIKMARYTASNGQWSAPIALAAATIDARTARVAIDRASGDALVTWAQDDGAGLSLYVRSYQASNNSWSTPQSLEASTQPIDGSIEAVFVTKTGDDAAVAWLQNNGTFRPNGQANNDVYLSRLVAGTWTAPAIIDTNAATGLHPEVAIDSNGNATVVWRQIDPGAGYERIHSRRWYNNTQSFGPVIVLSEDGDRQPRIRFDANGNGTLLWRGGGVYARHYDAATDTWTNPQPLHTSESGALNGELAVDANGDALATYVEYNDGTYSVYARFYDAVAEQWQAPVLLENMTTPADQENDPTISLVNGSGVVAWIHTSAEGYSDLYGARFANGAWGNATLLDTRLEESPYQATSAVDENGNATVLWVQDAGYEGNIFQVRSSGTPYFEVPAGATWLSLANTLYGVNTQAAADALSTAMGNQALSTGLHLSPLPRTLTVNPTVPTHYLVQSGDTWQSITLALYGTNQSEAATALWDYLSRPTLTVGQQLIIPAELSYTIEE